MFRPVNHAYQTQNAQIFQGTFKVCNRFCLFGGRRLCWFDLLKMGVSLHKARLWTVQKKHIPVLKSILQKHYSKCWFSIWNTNKMPVKADFCMLGVWEVSLDIKQAFPLVRAAMNNSFRFRLLFYFRLESCFLLKALPPCYLQLKLQ